jgi:hypothetical protein
MNDHFSPLESKLERAKERVVLSMSEKDAGREAVRAFISRNPIKKTSSSIFIHSFRFAFVLVLVVLTGSGASFAAEGALPGTLLYPVKVHVNEQVMAVFADEPEERASFEAERAGRRLNEYARMTAAMHEDQNLEKELSRSLVAHVEDAKDAIRALSLAEGESDALSAATELRTILEAHTTVLERLDEEDITSPDVASDTFETVLPGVLADAGVFVEELEAALPSATQEEIAETLNEEEVESDRLADAISEDISEVASGFDSANAIEAQQDLSEASVLIESAKAAEASGDLSEALLLYMDANEKLGRLSIFIEANAELGIDVIGEDPAE